MLYRSVKLLIEGSILVPILPERLVPEVIATSHETSGHCSWEKMYYKLRSRCYLPGITTTCVEFVAKCSQCAATNHRNGPSVQRPTIATVPVCSDQPSQWSQCAATNHRNNPSVNPVCSCIPNGPWEEVVIDTLELGPQRYSSCHCVFVCVDTYTKWLEVIPLPRHDAVSVAVAFTKICQVWGAPRILQSNWEVSL